MNINFWGTVYMTKALLPALTEAPRAAIVNVLSDFGLLGFPTKLPYCASKFAGRGFSVALRADLANTNISVHEVYPPAVDTAIVTSGRAWDAEKQAREAEFLRKRGWSSEATANAIVRGVERDRERILIGRDTRLIDLAVRLFPSIVPRFVANQRHRLPFL
jgi:short-subunit dehydrogenase